MKELTAEQVMETLNLAKHPLIAKVSVEVNKNVSRISIVSEIGANWDEVNTLIFSKLGYLFPGMDYMGFPAKFKNPLDDVEQELYFIDFNGETLLDLTMRLAGK